MSLYDVFEGHGLHLELLYRVRFANHQIQVQSIPVTPRPPHPGPIPWISTSATAGENPSPAPGPLLPAAVGADGLHLRITRPASATGNVVIMAGIAAPPASQTPKLLMAAFYSSPQGPDGLWAGTLVGRDGPQFQDTSTAHVGATHQTRLDATTGGERKISLGAGQPTPGTVQPPALLVPIATAYPPTPQRVREFVLATEIDRINGTGWCRLQTTGFEWPKRTWNHPYSPSTGGAVMEMIGVGVAIANGNGVASVIVHEFAVFAL